MESKLGVRKWLALILIGLFGQFAWTIENMYFNVFLYNTISTDPRYIASMVSWSAAAATLTTLVMGALSDRVGKRKLFICAGYILWGGATALFGLITPENAATLFPKANAAAAAAVMVVVLDCVMTFFGSTANDAAFNAYVTDVTNSGNRGRVESALAILPLISMLIIFGVFDGLTQQGRWREFFSIFGAAVSAVGVLSLVLIQDEPSLMPKKDSYLKNLVYGLRPGVMLANPRLYLSFLAFCLFSVAVQVFFPFLIIYIQNYLGIQDEPSLMPKKDSYLKNLVYGLRPDVMSANPRLYLSFLAFCLFSVAVQVFFPFLIIYIQNYLGIQDYALILGVVLILASLTSVFSGKYIDKMGKMRFSIPAAIVMLLGLGGMYFVRSSTAVMAAGTVMMSGYMMMAAALGAQIRDCTPSDKVGHFQGIRMIFAVLLPMMIGPAIGAAVIRGSESTYMELGQLKTVPTPEIYLAAAAVLITVVIPMLLLHKLEKGSRKQN